MEVKKVGIYMMANGEECEVYGFDDLGGGPMQAEGFDVKNRNMMWWSPETGKYFQNKPAFDIVSFVRPK